MDVSDRRMQVQLTQEAKIASDFFFYRSNFCGCGLCQRSEARLHCGGGPLSLSYRLTCLFSIRALRMVEATSTSTLCRIVGASACT